MTNYCALVPARNEAERIESTVLALLSRRELSAVVVIDDGSCDGTSEIALKAGATRVVRLANGRGKGGALEAGIQDAPAESDAFLFLDADLGPSATECVKLIAALERGEADMAIGLLPPDPALSASGQSGGGMGFVVGLARSGLKRRTGREFQQPLSGQRAVRRAIVDALGGKLPKGFGVEVGLTLAAVARGFRVLEVPTQFRHRVTGDDLTSNLHRAKQWMDVAAALRRTW